ncbi:MAG: hypothetical protein R2811_16085 [Flavobacteriales bacterium]
MTFSTGRTSRNSIIIPLLTALLFFGCSKKKDENPTPSGGGGSGTPSNIVGYSYLQMSANGTALNDTFTISLPAVGDPSDLIILGALVQEVTPEGLQDVVNLTYSTGNGPGGTVKDLRMSIPAEIASNAMGDFETTSTGVITTTPTFNIVMAHDSINLDINNDMSNDVLTPLLSTSNTVVTVTHYETAINDFGFETVSFIKGSISGTMDVLVFQGPTSAPSTSDVTVAGHFEYHLD